MSKIKILQEDCDSELAKDKSLPYTCYLVEYKDKEGLNKFDLVVGNKKVDIFDHYWDKYRDNFVTMSQSGGAVNPKMWNAPGSEPKKEEKKKEMTDNNLNVDINFDGIEQVKKKYKKIKKYMKSNLYQIKVIDGTEKVVSNLIKENDNAELLD